MRKRTRFRLWCSLVYLVVSCIRAQEPPPDPLSSLPLATTETELRTPAFTRTTTYYDLGCKHQGWEGYFAPRRWYKTAAFGDGGVDVTEAPNATVAEGVTQARLDVQTGSSATYTWRITVPADGYLYFRLEKIGSFLSPRISSTDTALQILHNDVISDFQPLPDGGYYSPHLKAGETFGIRFNGRRSRFQWSELTFYSNCVGVLVTSSLSKKKWVSDDVKPIPRANIDQVFFVANDPEEWPTVDQDGDLFTLDDQMRMRPSTESGPGPFNLRYTDYAELFDGQYWQVREFSIEEPCSGNTRRISRRWRPLPLLPPEGEHLEQRQGK